MRKAKWRKIRPWCIKLHVVIGKFRPVALMQVVQSRNIFFIFCNRRTQFDGMRKNLRPENGDGSFFFFFRNMGRVCHITAWKTDILKLPQKRKETLISTLHKILITFSVRILTFRIQESIKKTWGFTCHLTRQVRQTVALSADTYLFCFSVCCHSHNYVASWNVV